MMQAAKSAAGPPHPRGSVLPYLRAARDAHNGQVALVAEGRQWTFEQLHCEADRIAHAVMRRVGDGDEPVLLLCASGYELVTGALGIMLSGRPFVVLDARHPAQRLRNIFDDSAAVAIASGAAVTPARLLDPTGSSTIDLNSLETPATPLPEVDVPPERAVSIAYTSGSTGRPKGVVLSHARAIDGLSTTTAVRPEEPTRVGLLWSATAGLTGGQLLRPLSSGTTLCPFDLRDHGIEGLATWLTEERITQVFLVPTILRGLLDVLDKDAGLPHLRRVQCGGEAVSWRDVHRLRQLLPEDARIVCSYGSAEAGAVTQYVVPADLPESDAATPVGYPLEGRRVRILDGEGSEQAPEEIGEVIVDSPYLADGYWRRPDLTASTFGPSEIPGCRTLRTGDRGWLSPDGCLHLVGRDDGMVKVAGHRVELTEVETTLRQLPSVADAVVDAIAAEGADSHLIAAVVPSGDLPSSMDLRRQLASRLPLYMVPAKFEMVESLPLLPTGKVDRQAVRAARRTHTSQQERSPRQLNAPRNELEAQLARIWAETLNLDAVDVHDDFFELGGSSLQAATLFAKLETEVGYELDLSLILEAPTVALLAVRLEEDDGRRRLPVLVAIQEGDDGLPLFTVHPVYGSVLIYRDLAQQLGGRPVYGLQSPALDGSPIPGNGIPSLAASYIDEIRKVQPHGPYHLMGHSFGGAVAFEMACQLAQAGEDIAFVGIGDLPRSIRGDGRRRRNLTWWDRHARITRTRREGGGPYLVLRRAAGQLWWRSQQGLRLLLARRHAKRHGAVPRPLRDAWLWDIHHRALRDYRAPVFPGRLTLFRSQDPVSDPTLGWESHSRDGVEIVQLDGWHDQLWRAPHVFANAARVRAILDRLEHAE